LTTSACPAGDHTRRIAFQIWVIAHGPRPLHRPKQCDPAHRQKSHRSRLNASNDFFRSCEAASAKTRETSKPASAIKCSITLVLVGIIRRTTLNVNPNRGGIAFVSTERPNTNSAHHSFCQL